MGDAVLSQLGQLLYGTTQGVHKLGNAVESCHIVAVLPWQDTTETECRMHGSYDAKELSFIVLDGEANEVGTVELDGKTGYFMYVHKGEKSVQRFDSCLGAMGMLLSQLGVR